MSSANCTVKAFQGAWGRSLSIRDTTAHIWPACLTAQERSPLAKRLLLYLCMRLIFLFFIILAKFSAFTAFSKCGARIKFLPVFLLVFRKIIPAKVFPCYNLSLIAASSVIPSNNRAVPFHVICYPFLTTQVHMLFAVYRLITQHIRYFSLYLKFFSTAF